MRSLFFITIKYRLNKDIMFLIFFDYLEKPFPLKNNNLKI